MNIVVVLIPPAVPIGEPPINIKTALIVLPAVDNEFWSKQAKPAVLVVTDWKNDWKMVILPFSPSLRKNDKPPNINNVEVVNKTILVNADHCFGFFLLKKISIITTKEIPPKIMRSIM